MRLDYFCRLVVEDSKGRPVKASKLKKFHAKIIKETGSDFTSYMEDILTDKGLIGEPLQLIYDNNAQQLLARSSIHEGQTLSESELEQLTDFIRGQFIDGFGEDPLSLRKGFARYILGFDHNAISGPVKIDAPRPKPKPIKSKARNEKIKRLCLAAMEGDIETINSLLDQGVAIDAVPKPEETHDTVMSALGWAANRNQLVTLRLLVSRGANPNIRGSNGNTALMLAQSIEMIELLLEHGADPNIKDERGLDAIAYHKDQGDWWGEFEGIEHEEYKNSLALQNKIRDFIGSNQ